MSDLHSNPEMLKCCQAGHDLIGNCFYGNECLFFCVDCKKDYYILAVAFSVGKPEWWDGQDFSG